MAFLTPFWSPERVVPELFRDLYSQNIHPELWFRWEGKPLILANPAQVDPAIRDEIIPNNIIMIGPTGVGKTEMARRLAKLVRAPFVKVEATNRADEPADNPSTV